MALRKWRAESGLLAISVVVSGFALWAGAVAPEQLPATQAQSDSQPQTNADPQVNPTTQPQCSGDLANPGHMKDILANALTRGLKVPQRDVALYMDGIEDKYATGLELLKATSVHFKISEDVLIAKVKKYEHCNCSHPVPSALHPKLQVEAQPHPECDIDFENSGQMKDVVSNALVLGLEISAQEVGPFVEGSEERFEDGPELFKAASAHFKISEDTLATEVLKFKHVNCVHPGGGEAKAEIQWVDDGLPISAFARNVTLHVVLHEIGHGLIREFDIPVLGNEETMAEAFATYYITTYLPDRALDILSARVTSLMIEAGESPGPDWGGEHDHDGRRANQIAALAVAADPVKYKPVADIVKMSQDDIEDAVDYGSEIRRSWRRVLAPFFMPEDAASAKASVVYDDSSAFLIRLCEGGLANEIEAVVRRFDWHSPVTIRFVEGNGGAGWNRSARTVTVQSAYVHRFIGQGIRGLRKGSN